MTYNQLINEMTVLLESHAMIKTVRNLPPKEWLIRKEQVEYPVCCFFINSGSFNKGREQVYNAQFFFLDKSGAEAEFEREVISDQVGIAADIVSLMRAPKRVYSVDDNIAFTTLSDKYEDYLAGVVFTTDITTQSDFDGCDAPIV